MKHWDQLTRRDLREMQNHKLRNFLQHQVQPFSPHYGKILQDAGPIRTVEDLQKLPFTSKVDLLPTLESPKRPRDFLLQPDPDQLRRLPSTIFQALILGREKVQTKLKSEYQPLLLTSTTGRSADPIPFLHTAHDIRNLRYAGGRIIELGNVQSGDRVANLFPYAPHLAYWLAHYAAQEKLLFSIGTGGGKLLGTTGNLDLLEKIDPAILVGMPTFLYHLLRQGVEEGRQLPSLKCIAFGGEKVAEGTRRKLAKLAKELGATDISTLATYGFTEAKMAFPECATPVGEVPTGYHLYPDLGIVEIIDPETGEVLPEGEPGEIVFTPLDSRGTVVLRYRTGDLIEGGLVHERCPRCGRQVPRLVGRVSRVSGIHSMRLHKVKGTLVDFNEIEHVLDDLHEIGTWQVELRKLNDDPLELDTVILRATLMDGADPVKMEKLLETRLMQSAELRPNRIEFCTESEMRELQGLGKALKEERIVDRRSITQPAQPKLTPAPNPRRRRRRANANANQL
jgi:phenylacetate-CoA ligase